MRDRATLSAYFLARTKWGTAARVTIAGDASNRRYERLTRSDNKTAILMDAPPEKGEDTAPFIGITNHLRALNLSAPRILEKDTANGFLLLEDLGDDLFARVVAADPTLEEFLYKAAVDVLLHLHNAPPSNVAPYDSDAMTQMASLSFDWYQKGALGYCNETAKSAFQSELHAALAPLDDRIDVLIQRDYHAENLIWLPKRHGVARVGLLDYQDAMAGHRAYDLMSILQDARRFVSPEIARSMMAYYIEKSGVENTQFKADYALLGLQRNLRILGGFSRLSLAYGKPQYIDLIPRVWKHIQANLQHPDLQEISSLIAKSMPFPSPEILRKINDQCATIPIP
jgi:aminoglycoside/choline kinase family phosphotransferase